MPKLRFGIIGCGRIAQRHAEHINTKGELIAVCDIVQSNADELAERYSCSSYSSIDELLSKEKNIDVIAICTPNGLHAEHTIPRLWQ
jgi:UDP-N-acetyl-2-amino-2-deoxyglucuronate dehydrogenase